MQNRYAGDVGDFGKLGLLRIISLNTGLKIGVNWYLVPDENHNNDGKHIGYFSETSFKGCDDQLLKSLKTIVLNQNRNVAALERADLLPGVIYYNEILHSPGTQHMASRVRWHNNALALIKPCDIVFLDPDNGLLVKSVSRNSNKSNKYVFPEELADYYKSGKSIIFYNHRSRQSEEYYLLRFKELEKNNLFPDSKWIALSFRRGTVRDYFFILHIDHVKEVENALSILFSSRWKLHFH